MTTKEIIKNGTRSLVEVRDDLGHLKKYVVCTDYDSSKEYGNQWICGIYYDVLDGIKKEDALKCAVFKLFSSYSNTTLSYERAVEIAEKVIGTIKENLDEEDIMSLLEDAELTKEEAEYFNVDNVLYPKKYKVVDVELVRMQKVYLQIAMPEDDDYVEDYIPDIDYLEPEEDGEWYVDETSEHPETMSLEDVLLKYGDDLYNYEALKNGDYN